MNIFHLTLLSSFVVVPLLMLVVLFLCRNARQARTVMVIGSSILLMLAMVLTLLFVRERAVSNAPMLFVSDLVWYAPLNIHYSIGVDGISTLMLLLSAIIVFAAVFSSWQMNRDYFLWFCLLIIGAFGFFISTDLFTMFMFYETALIPMYLLVGIWGTGKKEYAAMKLALMLMGASALLLMGILGIYYTSGAKTMNVQTLIDMNIPLMHQYWIFPLIFIGFGTLCALFPFHTWSPDGYASAPSAVSMLHAGLLKKLGAYGCFRVAICLMPQGAHELSWIFITLAATGVVYGAFCAVRQTDLKYINAYSSVSHCGLILFAIMMLNETAMKGAVLQMLSHGLMAALFFAVIGMIYSRTHTRQLNEMSGLMKVIPFLSIIYIIAGFASLGLPGLSGFVAEMNIFVGAFEHDDIFRRVLTIAATGSIVITAVYILQAVGKIFYGSVTNEKHRQLPDAFWYDKVSTLILLAGVILIGLAPFLVSGIIEDGLSVFQLRI
ncbi:MAG: NADH-quinone oxidoreductase subunit M [Prevotellaceae bacterium]|jgi:NADH-quinone oxidoreductase subunit M|nr:NADH-quinone oxidoreductase subunit M [Prevotellaceae bacterium]